MAASLLMTASAEHSHADLWIGFQNSDNGFLINRNSGHVWMTGLCLKTLETATKSGDVWTSRTVELVSVGRDQAILDQTFLLNTGSAPSVQVLSQGRGGEQSFPAIIDEDCETNGLCADLIATQTPCAE